jgi:hypothetical protein
MNIEFSRLLLSCALWGGLGCADYSFVHLDGGRDACEYCAAPDRCDRDSHGVGTCLHACAAGCLAGRACLALDDGDAGAFQYCSQSCDSHLCPTQQECTSPTGECVTVQCGKVVTCQQATSICDVYGNTCYPANGSCVTVADCPRFSDRLRQYAETSCSDGFCRLSVPMELPGLPAPPAHVTVLRPTPGMSFGSQSDMVFDWVSDGHPAIALVFQRVPTGDHPAIDDAIWGVSITAKHPTVLSWRDGFEIQGGTWLSGPGIPPVVQPLYFYVQTVANGQLVAAGPLVPFIVGGRWPQPGDPCPDEGALPSTCASPIAPLICFGGQCRIRCLSNNDCANAQLRCGPLEAIGSRICE